MIKHILNYTTVWFLLKQKHLMAEENWNIFSDFQANTLLVHQLLKYFSILKIYF